MKRFKSILLLACLMSLPVAANDAPSTQAPPVNKESVTGIGGFFFRAEDPPALSQWYHQHLGISPVPTSYEEEAWQQRAGATVFSPFPQNSEAFGPKTRGWMINFRVDDLQKMVAQLRKAGIAVEVDPQAYPNGWFAQLNDPEGNPIQLWQPK